MPRIARATAARSRMSALTNSASAGRCSSSHKSRTRTSSPRASKRRTIASPRKPDPPVTRCLKTPPARPSKKRGRYRAAGAEQQARIANAVAQRKDDGILVHLTAVREKPGPADPVQHDRANAPQDLRAMVELD